MILDTEARETIWWVVTIGAIASLLWAWFSLPDGPFSYFLFVAAISLFPMPLLLVLRWNLLGALLGTVLAFGSLMVWRRIGEGLDPTFHGDDPITWTEKTAVGLAVAATFCLLIYGTKRLTIWLCKRLRHAGRA
jgi:hypothetical protein